MLDNSVIAIISGAVTLLGTFTMMLVTNVWLTLITVIFIPLMLRGSMAIMRRSRRYYTAQQSALGAVNGYIEETVSGQKVVKAFCPRGDLRGGVRPPERRSASKAGGRAVLRRHHGPVLGNISKLSYAVTAGRGRRALRRGGF